MLLGTQYEYTGLQRESADSLVGATCTCTCTCMERELLLASASLARGG